MQHFTQDVTSAQTESKHKSSVYSMSFVFLTRSIFNEFTHNKMKRIFNDILLLKFDNLIKFQPHNFALISNLVRLKIHTSNKTQKKKNHTSTILCICEIVFIPIKFLFKSRSILNIHTIILGRILLISRSNSKLREAFSRRT